MTDQKTVILDDSELDVSPYEFLRKELSQDQETADKQEGKNEDPK